MTTSTGRGHTCHRPHHLWVDLGLGIICMTWTIAAWEMDTVGVAEVVVAGETSAPSAVVHPIVASETGDTAGLGATLVVAPAPTAAGEIVATGTVDDMTMTVGGMKTTGAGALPAAIAAKAGAAPVSATAPRLQTAGSTTNPATFPTSLREEGASAEVAALPTTTASTALPRKKERERIPAAGVVGAGAGIVEVAGANAVKAVAVTRDLRQRDVVAAGADPGTDIDCYHNSFMTRVVKC
mmetsp:Transcript_24820/g.51934  ORF Transcript_24820/g.51934 Transcript_24820/m.51934 type:complete len:239 (-) Transcript_24820:208-924(-)